jgi:hypothetical protein
MEVEKLINWIENEICERRSYSSTKTFELVLAKINSLKLECNTLIMDCVKDCQYNKQGECFYLGKCIKLKNNMKYKITGADRRKLKLELFKKRELIKNWYSCCEISKKLQKMGYDNKPMSDIDSDYLYNRVFKEADDLEKLLNERI